MSRDQNCNFRKFKMADGRHFENTIISIISAENYPISIKFGPPMHISIPRMHFRQKIVFAYISVPYWPINAKFGPEIKDHVPIQDT